MNNSRFLKIGHRGASGHEPENTLRSFKKAIELGADMVEADVWLSNDNKIVVIHDETVDRTTNGQGQVKNFTLAELQKLNAGLQEKVPSLTELLALVKGYCQLNLEVKIKAVAQHLISELQNNDFPFEDLLISSNHLDIISNIKKQIPALKTAWVFKSIQSCFWQAVWSLVMTLISPVVHWHVIRKLKFHNIEIINLYHSLATKRFIAKLHRHNKRVFVWTVNDKNKIKKLRNFGADGIFSNYPERL